MFTLPKGSSRLNTSQKLDPDSLDPDSPDLDSLDPDSLARCCPKLTAAFLRKR